ncbi:MAG: cation-transporting P-type ATPase [Anaerolineales bacterium]|nr:cation-transporting P-type ATPase [Anaerolineales bacterium]
MDAPIYSLRVADVFAALETSPAGLSNEEAQARRALYGQNLLEEQARVSWWSRLRNHAVHPMALLLWGAGILALLVRQPALALVIWALVLANAGFSFWREYRAEQELEALKHLLPSYARIVREGEEQNVPTSDVVPGDVLILAEGDNIAADARVVEEYGLRINNASLTGESMPAHKTAEASFREGISELERPNLIFAGTSVVSGTGRAVVYSTGMLTQFGRIAHLTQAIKEEPSPFQQELVRMTSLISRIAIGVGAVVFTVGILDVGMGIFEAFLLALGIIVAIIPEGLPATITLSLAMAAQRLAHNGVLVKKLAIIETLGNVSLICTDKSGTLTQNQMTVREVWVGLRRLSVSGVGYEPKGRFLPAPSTPEQAGDLESLLQAASLCNNSRLNPPSPEHAGWSSLGDQTEAALRVAALKGGVDEQALMKRYPRQHELPFDARRKRMTTIHRNAQGTFAFVKGAPREVLQLCKSILINGQIQPIDGNIRSEILEANDDYARNALRVLALAQRELPARAAPYTPENVEQELTFLGLLAMLDPPRPEVAEAVKQCRQAGIRLTMITGDYGLTAESLARRVGMLSEANPVILTGAELDQLDDYQLQAALEQEVIFARMAPEHKLRLVAAYQARGEVVVVTGDGVNDAPALRKADVGVSMGVIGTDVAKEAADIVLADDNFANIANAIGEGRAVYDNLRKFITYIFSSNVPEITPFLMTAMLRLPLALTVPQILAIDLGTDLLPALALGAEKPEPGIMDRPPRRRTQPLVDNRLLGRAFLWLGMIEAGLCFLGFYAVYHGWLDHFLLRLAPGIRIPPLFTAERYLLAITVYHAGVVAAQVGNVFACRSERNLGKRLGFFSNKFLVVGVVVEIALIFALIYIPDLARIFNHYPLPGIYWIGLALFAPALYLLEAIRKGLVGFRIISTNHHS